MAAGLEPVPVLNGDPVAAVNAVPLPSPSITLMVLSVWLATAKSRTVPALKYPVTTAEGPLPTAIPAGVALGKAPLPSPWRMSIAHAAALLVWPATQRSERPAPQSSPNARAVHDEVNG